MRVAPDHVFRRVRKIVLNTLKLLGYFPKVFFSTIFECYFICMGYVCKPFCRYIMHPIHAVIDSTVLRHCYLFERRHVAFNEFGVNIIFENEIIF